MIKTVVYVYKVNEVESHRFSLPLSPSINPKNLIFRSYWSFFRKKEKFEKNCCFAGAVDSGYHAYIYIARQLN
jgi:hypothetical protein